MRVRTSGSSDSGAMKSVRNAAMSPEGAIALLCGQRHGPS
jgi:hypothetical protein